MKLFSQTYLVRIILVAAVATLGIFRSESPACALIPSITHFNRLFKLELVPYAAVIYKGLIHKRQRLRKTVIQIARYWSRNTYLPSSHSIVIYIMKNINKKRKKDCK